MKKVLSIVLALAMVLCMIPMLSAETTKTVTTEKQKYDVTVATLIDGEGIKAIGGPKTNVNSIEAEYDYEKVVTAQTGKWTEDKKMAVVSVSGFSFTKADVENEDHKLTITINGKKLDVSQNAWYKWATGEWAIGRRWNQKGIVNFPAELTEAGYSEDYLIVATWENGDTEYTEIAKIAAKFTNTNKPGKADDGKAIITDIKLHKCDDHKTAPAAVVYIVGSKIYIDFEGKKEDAKIDITFAAADKTPFTAISYAWDDADKVDPACNIKKFYENDDLVSYAKLNKSVGTFGFTASNKEGIEFKLETEEKYYAVDKKYDYVIREYVHEEDPKGVYLAESEVTIAVGQEYIPVVKTANKGAIVTPTALSIDKESVSGCLDYTDKDKVAVIGVKPGVAYITATYAKDYTPGQKGDSFSYKTSTQKVTVVLPGTSIPTQTVDYVVTCRNLNVRKGAGTSFGKTGMVHRGDVLKVVEIANGWAKLADGTYVCAKYITK